MKTKKSKKANLEKFRTIFFQIGLILALLAILVAFEWKSAVKIEKLSNDRTTWIDIEDLPPITKPEEEKKEIVKPPTPIEKLIIEKDDVIIEEEPIFAETEIDWDEAIPIFEKEIEKVVDSVYVKVEFMPTFKKQEASYFRNYIANNIKFPIDAIEHGVRGKVYISFVVDENGDVTDIEVVRGVHPVIDNAVIDVIKKSPEWEPGIQQGKFVKVKFSIAIAFDLI